MVMNFIPLAAAGKLPFSLLIFMMVMVLLLGAPVIYGDLATQMNMILIIYVVILLASRQDMPRLEHKGQLLKDAVPLFVIAALITGILFYLLSSVQFMSSLLVASTLESSIEFIAVFGFMHAFVKAYVEEEVFRGRLSLIFGEAGQAILFGAFHFFILLMLIGWSPMLLLALGWLTFLGFVWGKLENRGGLAASTGSHFGYNLVAMGMAAFIFGGVVM